MSDKPRKQDANLSESRGRCPICSRPSSQETLPFCSARCRDVDLNRWLTGSYVIPSREDDAEDSE